MINIPIYRAKIDIETLARGNNIEEYLYRVIRHYVNRGTIIKNEDDYYAIGLLNSYDEIEVFDEEDKQVLKYPCFKNTLAIHFPDMLDSQENKIFASLYKENGKGGDIVEDCLINFDYDEYIIKGYLFFDNPSKAILVHNFFERTKRKNEQFASEHRPKVKYSSYQSLLRAKVIGIQK